MAWLGPLLIVNVFVWIIFWTPEASDAVCARSENCLTDWLGSLGGWVAAGAAYLTIRAMNSQRKEADKHQREFVELEIMSRIALARRLLRSFKHRIGIYVYLSGEARNLHSGAEGELEASLPKYLWYLGILEEELASDVLLEFDDKIGLNSKVVASGLNKVTAIARQAAATFQESAENAEDCPDQHEMNTATAIARISEAFEGGAQFFRDAVTDADGFIAKWQDRVSP